MEGAKKKVKDAFNQATQQYDALRNKVALVMGADFYQGYTWTHDKEMTEEDAKINKSKPSPEDRIMDVLLIMDCTGSMSSWIELSKRTLSSCITEVMSKNEDFIVRVAFVGYRDFGDGNQIFAVKDFTVDQEKVTKFIAGQSATGGNDAAEDVQGGLVQGLDLNWRSNSVKLAFFCADAQAHGSQYNGTGAGDNWPQGNPGGLVLEELMQEYSDNDIAFVVYQVNNETTRMYSVMEKSYKSGKNKDNFAVIDLRQAIADASKQGQSNTHKDGIVEKSYAEGTADFVQKTISEKRLKNGW